MKSKRKPLVLAGMVALLGVFGSFSVVKTQDEQFKGFLTENQDPTKSVPHNPPVQRCTGPISRVLDVGLEGVRTTAHNWSNPFGGGESGRFDPTPLLSTGVTLTEGTCLNAHLSGMVGSRQTYGPAFSSITMFQVTLTPPGGAPQHMFGHFETPYGIYGPAVALSAEHDVDMYSSNFFQRVGFGPGEVPPGNYRVDVWWAGGPVGGGGAIGADFILKLYMR
jgi:hypothetical protein